MPITFLLFPKHKRLSCGRSIPAVRLDEPNNTGHIAAVVQLGCWHVIWQKLTGLQGVSAFEFGFVIVESCHH